MAEQKCICCHRFSPHQAGRVCPTCSASVLSALSQISRAAEVLQDLLQPGSGGPSGRGPSGKPGSRPPLSIHVLSLLGPDQGDDPTDPSPEQHGSPSILTALGSWARTIWLLRDAQEWGQEEYPARFVSLSTAALWLLRQHAWTERHLPQYADFAYDMKRLSSQIQQAAGDPAPRTLRLGGCPMPVDTARECGTLLTVTTDAMEIVCGGCGTTWSRWSFRQLGRMIEGKQR